MIDIKFDKYIRFSKRKNILPGALHFSNGGFLNPDHVEQFLSCAHRAECDMNPVVYCKAIRATLIALGFDYQWVDGEFREQLEGAYL